MSKRNPPRAQTASRPAVLATSAPPTRPRRAWAGYTRLLPAAIASLVLATGLAAIAFSEVGAPRLPRRHLPSIRKVERLRCLFNGYLLTVDPTRALAASNAADRYRLWVLHAVLIHPDTGRIVAIFPALGTPAFEGGPVARPVSAYAQLAGSESPAAPGISQGQLVEYWRRAGVSESLLATADWLDLQGAVATPGIVDSHFHVSSWSKKLPAPGERFGYYADLSDPAYYIRTSDWSRTCSRDALWRIVADANAHLVETGDTGILLHGYIYTNIDNPAGNRAGAFLYASSASCSDATFNPDYLLNRVGASIITVPENPCETDTTGLPPVEYPVLPALLVQTSGQACWYNSALLTAYNDRQERIGTSLAPIPLTAAAPTGTAAGDQWRLSVQADAEGVSTLFAAVPPFQVDVVVDRGPSEGVLTVPFDIVASDPPALALTGQAMIPELANAALAGSPSSLHIKPFFRPIVACITKAQWDAAAAYWGETPATDPVGYGSWDPRNPYGTNWYNGSKRGLIQYFYDTGAQVWRPTGYAEHYPMRDALAAVVVKAPSLEELIEQRRRTAAWCQRHGVTMTNDIMFYRRDSESAEFDAYEAVTFDRTGDTEFFSRVGLDPAVPTGNLGLRVGLYYYVETGDDVDDTLRLAHSTNGSDLDRLKPAPTSPEYPGWVRWLGWKLQLDGSSLTKNFFSNAPLPKTTRTDPVTVSNEYGGQVTFQDHSFGLLTMTDLQEQVFTSRESAALYWLVRESDPTSSFKNPQIPRDWSGLRKGVVNFLGQSVNAQLLAQDLTKLSHVGLSAAQASQLAGKIAAVLQQVNDAWERTLSAIIRIWFERSRSPQGLPPMPSQTVCHVSGDGAVDLWGRAIKQLKTDVEHFPSRWVDLPQRWKAVIPETADLAAVRQTFQGERFRMEHLLFISRFVLEDIAGPGGIDALSTPAARNVVVTLQPAIFLLDGGEGEGYPFAQELWPIPNTSETWLGLPALPRQHHVDALTSFLANNIPMTINTDPPAMRDPRPALTVLGAVTRAPIEIDPTHWADQTGSEPAVRPPDYLAGKVYAPFGLVSSATTNPMQLTIEQALAAMTFWGAYSANWEDEIGALAVPSGTSRPGWFADIVVWRYNPLAITGPGGLSLEVLGRTPAGVNDEARLATVNEFIQKFLPSMTIVAGVPVYRRPGFAPFSPSP